MALTPTNQDDDPLTEALKPPADETEMQRRDREEREERARDISATIDAEIKAERMARRKRRIVRLLLLGQSESGKSTTLRQFQRLYTPTAFREERILWRAVIQLNVVKSVRVVLDTLEGVGDERSPRRRSPRRKDSPRRKERRRSVGVEETLMGVSVESGEEDDEAASFSSIFSAHPHLNDLRLRLLPLRHVENLLVAKLVPPNEGEATHLGWGAGVGGGVGSGWAGSGSGFEERGRTGAKEIFVRPGRSVAPHALHQQDDEVQETIHRCRDDIIRLWKDPIVKSYLRKRKVRVEEGPGFFLDDLDRVGRRGWVVSDDDVLRARLKTVGAAEYRFEMEVAAGRESGTEWRIVDVGGGRGQRQTWVPFFDDVDAIIFLAPISGFDQVLPDSPTTNRLEDSVLLWKSLCANKLLASVDLILFLNKCDILEGKLKGGIKMSKYVKSYGERENDLAGVSKYLRSKFNAIHREYSPQPRKFYAFCTSVTDVNTTAGIIASVRDMVIRQHLKQSKLL